MKASVIIPTFNKLPRLKLALASLQHQTCPAADFEVIIVDDGSTDGTADYLQNLRPPFTLKYIRSHNRGRAAARNQGIAAAQNDLLIFTDDDLILSPDFIRKHRQTQNEKPQVVHGRILNLTYLKFFADPTLGILYPHLQKQSDSFGELRKKCISETDIHEHFDKIREENNKVTAFETVIETVLQAPAQKSLWIGFTGGNVSLPKAWMTELGSFDEAFGLLWGYEDIEMGYRLFEKNYPFFYCYAASNYHIVHYRDTLNDESDKTIAYFYKKHHNENIHLLGQFAAGKIRKEVLINSLIQG